MSTLLFCIIALLSVSLGQQADLTIAIACPRNVMPEVCPAAMLDECTSNADCAADRMCCQSGCFRKCIPRGGNPPTQKPGTCPVIVNIMACTNVFNPNQCRDDSVCPGAQKCCSNGCQNLCMDVAPPNPTKQCDLCNGGAECAGDETCCGCGQVGVCQKSACLRKCAIGPCTGLPPSPPPPPPPPKAGQCPSYRTDLACALVFNPNQCKGDHACPGDKKCCFTGCQRGCVDPVVEKKGTCPVEPALGIACPAVVNPNDCKDDTSCPGNQKCCRSGCSRTCVDVVVEKKGRCPVVPVMGIACPAVVNPNDCRDDNSCPGDQKCCSSRCSRTCVDAVVEKKGHCPSIPARLIACPAVVNPNDCKDDNSCPGEQKCCSNACSRTCVDVTPKPTAGQTCSLCGRGALPSSCPAGERCCGCGRTGKCTKGPCLMRCAIGPCSARAEDDEFAFEGAEGAADPSASTIPSETTSATSAPTWAIAAYVVLGVILVILIVVVVQLRVLSKKL